MKSRMSATGTPNHPPTALSPPLKTWSTLWRMVPYLGVFRARIAVALIFLILAKLSGVVLPQLLKHLVSTLSAVESSVIVFPATLLIAYGTMRFANVLFGELRDVVFGKVAERVQRFAAVHVFEHLHRLDLEFHLSRRTGSLAMDIEKGVNGISFLLRFAVLNILPTILEILLVTYILLRQYGWMYASVAFVSVAIYIAFSVSMTEWRTKFVRAANVMEAKANGKAVDSLLNYETVKYFDNESYEVNRYDHALEEWERAVGKNRSSLSALNVGQALIVGGSILLILWRAAMEVASHRLNVGDFVAINAYMVQLFVPLNFFGFIYREMRRALTDMQKMFGVLDQKSRIVDKEGAVDLQDRLAGITFENITFGYGPKRTILNGVTFEVKQGRKVAVVGASGAGKSTIARLLFRFYDPTSGSIRINGHDLRELRQGSLRAMIGVVPQDTVLFNETLAYNIGFGKPDATRADVENAARRAHLEQFILSLPDGYDTVVGERGLKLSGGEKQRVAIARAILKDPPILILDEATSSLDSKAEQAILGALREASSRRTTLVIAHRLSTITDADEIIVIDGGVILERGSHGELLALGGAYSDLWCQQHSVVEYADGAG